MGKSFSPPTLPPQTDSHSPPKPLLCQSDCFSRFKNPSLGQHPLVCQWAKRSIMVADRRTSPCGGFSWLDLIWSGCELWSECDVMDIFFHTAFGDGICYEGFLWEHVLSTRALMFGFFMKGWFGLDCRVLTPCARGSSSSGCPRHICVASLVFANFMVNKDGVL